MTRRRAIAWLTIVTLVWGASFSLVKEALTSLSPLLFIGARFGIATLLIVGLLRGVRRADIRAGVILGLLFWVGFVFQTFGLAYTTPSRSAFITSLSSLLTPIIALMMSRVAPPRSTLLAIAIATGGMYLLTSPDGGGMNKGDLLTLGCAVLFAGHIVAVSHFARQSEPGHLLAIQLGLSSLLSLAVVPFVETPRFAPTVAVSVIVIVLALSALWSFYMQLRAQRDLSPSDAALVFMLEPVFATMISFVALGERFTPTQWAGGALILGALAIPLLAEREIVADSQLS